MRMPRGAAVPRVHLFRAFLPRKLGSGASYFAMIAMNAIGVGLFAPFSVLYVHQVAGLSLPLVGLGLSVATGSGLLVIPLGGSLIDRFGARPIAIAVNLISGVGMSAYLIVHSFGGFLLVALVVAVGASGGAIAGQALAVDLAAVEERDRWYALMRMASNAGTGAGALLAGALVAGGETTGYRWIVGLSGMSFVLAGALLLLVGSQQVPAARQRAQRGRSGTYRSVLRDRLFLLVMAVAALISIGAVVLEIALPPYLIINLHAPVWLVGLLFALNTGMIVLLQVPATRAVTSWRRTRILAAGAVGYAFSFLLFAAAPLLPSNAIALYLCGCMLVYTVAEIIFVPTFAAITAALIPIGMQGRYLAIFQLSRASAATITPAVSGSLLALAPQGLWLLLALLTFGTLALLRRLERRLPGVGCRLSAH